MAKTRGRYTPRWLQFYNKGVGGKPGDSYWRRYHDDLERVFQGLCAYCEESTRGEVEHFRPKSQFPDLVYCWSNWLFSCYECNRAKGSKWPAGGYVDPCAVYISDRPEHHFQFDTLTGFIRPHGSLSPSIREKAQRTIDDLGLNDFHHLKSRVERLLLFSARMPEAPNDLDTCTRDILVYFVSRKAQLSSLVRTWLTEHGFPLDELGESKHAMKNYLHGRQK